MPGRFERGDLSNIVQLKNDRKDKPKRDTKLKKLKPDIMIEGFLSCDASSDNELIENLQEESKEMATKANFMLS